MGPHQDIEALYVALLNGRGDSKRPTNTLWSLIITTPPCVNKNSAEVQLAALSHTHSVAKEGGGGRKDPSRTGEVAGGDLVMSQ